MCYTSSHPLWKFILFIKVGYTTIIQLKYNTNVIGSPNNVMYALYFNKDGSLGEEYFVHSWKNCGGQTLS